VPSCPRLPMDARMEASHAHAFTHPYYVCELDHANWLEYRGLEQRALFSELWPPHAHFHGAWFSSPFQPCLSGWSGHRRVKFDCSRTAALIQGCIWVAFLPAMLVPDTALADPGKQLVQFAGIELNLVGAAGNIALLAGALALLHGRPVIR
jgi:hypothetical protein